MTSGIGESSPREIRDAVRNTRRRYVLYYVNQNGGVVNLNELVDRITTWEDGGPSDDVPTRRRKSVYSSLYQTHLPKLERIGLIRYDVAEKTVSITEAGKRVSLRCAADMDATQIPKLLLPISAVTVAILALGWMGIFSSRIFSYVVSIPFLGLLAVVLWQWFDLRALKRKFRLYGPDYVVEVDERRER